MLDPDDTPVTVLVKTESGRNIDLNNLPGKTKLKLIKSGEIETGFQTPPNMPGKALKELRQKQQRILDEQLGIARTESGILEVGTLIEFEEAAYPIEAIEKGKAIIKVKREKGDKLVDVVIRIPVDKVIVATPEKGEETDNENSGE